MGNTVEHSAQSFSKDVSDFWKYWKQDGLGMRQELINGDPYDAIRRIAVKYHIARSFRTRFDVGVGLRRYAPVVEALQHFHPNRVTDPVQAVIGLTGRLHKIYEREVLSASSKFLWFLWGHDVIIYDSQALKSLRTLAPHLNPKDYVGYCEAWTIEFSKSKTQISEECIAQRAPLEDWFYQRVFDWHLWRLGK